MLRIVVSLVLLFIGPASLAGQLSAAALNEEPRESNEHLSPEESFKSRFGTRAIRIAPGVYRVSYGNHRNAIHAFGANGLKFDLRQATDQLEALRLRAADQDSLSAREYKNLKIAEGRVEHLKALESSGNPLDFLKGTRSGYFCEPSFEYELFGSFFPASLGGTTVASSRVELVPFGPPPPPHNVTAYAEAIAYNGSGEYYSADFAEGVDYAEANASTECGLVVSCTYWEAYLNVTVQGCGYRSYNPSGNL